MMETAPGPCNPVRIKQEPVEDLTVLIKTEPVWESEENTSGLPDYTKNYCPEILQEETKVYPTVKQEPVEIAFEEFVEDKQVDVDPLATCKKEITEQIVKKEELLDYPNNSSPVLISEGELEKNPVGDSKNNVLVNIVPFLKQDLDSNLHSIHKRRSSSVSAESCSESVPVFDNCEDSASNCPESPRLVIAEPEDNSNGADVSEPRSLLGDGWRVTVFRCGHCMMLAWDVFRLAHHDCCIPQNRKLNGTILGRLRRGTQVKYVNTFGCHVCGKLFFKRKSYRKHVCTMHSEEMLLPFVKYRAYSEGDDGDQSLTETPKKKSATRPRSDSSRENSLETDPKLSHDDDDDDEMAAEDSAVSDLQLSFAEDDPNVCVVCSKESCQIHKYTFIRAKNEGTEETPTFVCHKCVRDFRCEENYWRHIYYHGFKMENVLEEEPAAVSQPDAHVSTKKKTRKRRKKGDSLQIDESDNISSLPDLLSLAELCSSKSGSQREGAGGAGKSATTAEVCFAPAHACEFHNPHLTASRRASKNKKRKISNVSLTSEDGPDPNKKRCVLPTVEHPSLADDSVTVDTEAPPGCPSPMQSCEALWPRSSPTGDVCSSEEREEGCAVEGETPDVNLDDVSSEALPNNERSTREAENEEEIQIITEKLSGDRNGFSSTARGNVSAVTSTDETCASPSLHLRQELNKTAVEVIDIDDDDDDDDHESGDTNNINGNGGDDRTSSFPVSASFEIRETCDGQTEVVPVQQNVGVELDCSRYTSERGHCQLEKIHGDLQSKEVDSCSKERDVGSADSTSGGERPQATACKQTVGALQSVGIPLVRSGVSYGARVAVFKCVNGDNNVSHLGHEKQPATGCDRRTGVKLLQVSNTAVYHTVPIRQVTKLTLVPTVRASENSGGTVSNLRVLSKLSLDVSGTPPTGTCLLKCEKCNMLGAYGPEFFSHKCPLPKCSTNNGSQILSLKGLRVVTNGTTGLFSNSEGGSSQYGSVAPNKNLAGTVVWKCLRCNFATYHSDVFKSHSCVSVARVEVPCHGQMPVAETRCDAETSPGAEMRCDAETSPGAETRCDAKTSPGAETSPDTITKHDTEVSPGAVTVYDADASPCAVTVNDVKVSPGAVTLNVVEMPPDAVTICDADKFPSAVTVCDVDESPGAVTVCDVDESPGAVTVIDVDESPGAVTVCDADKLVGAGTICESEESSGGGTIRDTEESPDAGWRRDVSVSPGARKRRDVNVSPGMRTKLGIDVAPRAPKKRSDRDVAPNRPVEYLWKCMGCSLNSNSRQCLLMHKCSSFKRKATGAGGDFSSGPVLMCCKCGFKTAGRLMFATHQCARFDLPPWWPRDNLLMRRSDRGVSGNTSVKGQ